ncbi:MAG: Abi family protein [Sphaerochaetaceae bacterium]
MATEKAFLTYEEQVQKLLERGLGIFDVNEAIEILSSENYYRLINGYKELFLDSNHNAEKYRTGSSLPEIFALYKFDEELRFIFLRRFLSIENVIKTSIAYEFSKEHENSGYLNIMNFNYQPKAQQEINKLVNEMSETLQKKARYDDRIRHYQNKYGCVYLWVLINILTLGTVSIFYKNMRPHEQNEVARKFGLRPHILNLYLKAITLARNTCAHNERFFSFRFKTGINPLPEHTRLGIPKTGQEHDQGIHDVFAILLVVKSLLNNPTELYEMKVEINNALYKLQKSLMSISIDQVLFKMGFPDNWQSI